MAKKETKTMEEGLEIDSNFEKKLEKLEKIVRDLEDGDMGLSKSLKKFEEGVILFKECKSQFAIAEKKITELTENLKENDL